MSPAAAASVVAVLDSHQGPLEKIDIPCKDVAVDGIGC
jgi:hypothetical protein